MMGLPRGGRVTGRGRILAWVLGVTAMGLALLILAVSFVLRANVDATMDAELAQEAGEISRFVAEGVDPSTGKPFTDARRFLEVYVGRQEAGRGELVVGIAEDGLAGQSQGEGARSWADLPAPVRELVQRPGSTGRDSFPETGTVSWRSHPVDVGGRSGQIVLVRFHEPLDAEVRRQLLVLVALAAAALVATGLVSWVVAGRVLAPVLEFEQEAAQVASSGVARMNENGSDEYARLARAGNSMLERAEAALGEEQQFSEHLAHVVRTPLAILRGQLEDAVARGDHRLGPSLAEVLRMERAVSSLVLLNRSGRADFVTPQPVAIEDVLRDLVVRWTAASGPGAAPKLLLGAVEPADVEADVARLGRAMDELVSNGLEACRDSGQVEVSSVVEGDQVVIRVLDSGVGIPDGQHGLVLERFARAGNAHKDPIDPAAGAGLGLSVARVVVEAHGGELVLGPSADGGTVAQVRLPLAD